MPKWHLYKLIKEDREGSAHPGDHERGIEGREGTETKMDRQSERELKRRRLLLYFMSNQTTDKTLNDIRTPLIYGLGDFDLD